MDQSLEDIFNGVEQPEVAPQEEAPTAEAETEPVEEVEAKQEEAPAASEEPEAEESWTKAAVLDERRKRQERDVEIEKLQSQLRDLQAPKEKVETPDIFENQEAYTQHLTGMMQQAMLNERVSMSQEFMRMQDPDYDLKESQFIDMAKENPILSEQLKSHAMPAKFVVDTVNKANQLRDMENIDEYKAKIRAEIEAEMRAELAGEAKSKADLDNKVTSIKPSLANARSSNASDIVEQSLEDMFGR